MQRQCIRLLNVIWHRNAFKVLPRWLSSKPATYQQDFAQAINNPEEFWAEKAEKLVWYKKWDKVLANPNSPFPNWFEGGLLNATYNCLDRHVVEGHGSQIAVIQDSPVTGTRTQYTYETLLNHVSRLAGYLSRQCKVNKGDRVLIYMPMIPECMIAMLAAVRIGAIHTVVFGGFSADQLAVRVRNAKPKVIITASYGVEPKRKVNYKEAVDEALNLSKGTADTCRGIFFQRPSLPSVDVGKDGFFVDWGAALAEAEPHDPVPVSSSHPMYLIYTSGTTGDPKGIVRDTAGHCVALKYTADKIYDIRANDVWWAASEFGWVVGHSYCAYAPLLQRATSVLYEGKPVGTPDAAQFFRVAAENKVNGWFLTPSAMRAVIRDDPDLIQSQRYMSGEVNLNNLRNLFIAGEHLDASTAKWLACKLPPTVRLSDTWWQTETGWPITSGCIGYPDGYMKSSGLIAPEGSAGLPVPGYNVHFVEQTEGNTSSQSVDMITSADGSSEGIQLKRILVKLPMPPGTVATLWNDDEKFAQYYFKTYPGYFDTMDLGHQDANGYIYILSRADDVINVSGHRLSTSSLEEACLAVPCIVDCAVIAIPDEVKGHIPFGVLVAGTNTTLNHDEMIKAVIQSVRKIVGPVSAFSKACVVPKLPRTRSGKISRASLADMASSKPVRVPITIEDITVYPPIYEAFKKAGLNPSKPPTHL